jgi:hypothetical protein
MRKKKMNLFEFYESILNFGGMEVSSDGYIKTSIAGDPMQVLIGGKSLVMPTREHLATLVETKPNGLVEPVKIVFHPLRENVIRGEAADLRKIRETIALRFNASLSVLFEWLLRVANDPALQKRKNKELMSFMTSLSEASAKAQSKIVDDKTFKNYNMLLERGMKDPDKFFIKLYIKRGGKIGKERYNRVTNVSFPFYKELMESEKRVVHGVKLRIKDVEVFKAIYRFIFKDIDNELAYLFGSTSEISPGLDSLLTASAHIANRINKLITTFKYVEKGADLDLLTYNLDWVEFMEDLESHKAEIMAIPNHSTSQTESKPEPVPHSGRGISPRDLVSPQPTSTAPPPPIHESAPLPHTGRGLDPRALGGTSGGYPVNQMIMVGAYNTQPMYPPQPQYGYNNPDPYQNQMVPGFVNRNI